MQEEPGLETRMAKAKSGVWNVRGRWVLGKKSRGGGTENKKGGVRSPRCRIETALNPGRTQTKEKGRHENRDYSTKEAMWRWETGRVEGR
jgi:hypothetical protein